MPRAQRRGAGDARLVRAGRVALDGVRHGRGLRRTGRIVQQRVRRDVAAGGEGDVRGASRDGRAVGVQGGGRSGGVQCEPDRGGPAAAGAAEPAGVVGRRADYELTAPPHRKSARHALSSCSWRLELPATSLQPAERGYFLCRFKGRMFSPGVFFGRSCRSRTGDLLITNSDRGETPQHQEELSPQKTEDPD